jgi:hypothetical protein
MSNMLVEQYVRAQARFQEQPSLMNLGYYLLAASSAKLTPIELGIVKSHVAAWLALQR